MHFPSEVRERLMNLASSSTWPSLPTMRKNQINKQVGGEPAVKMNDHLSTKNSVKDDS